MNDDENKSSYDLQQINDIRSIYINKLLEFQNTGGENYKAITESLQQSIIAYYSILRPHIKHDLKGYWHNKTLYEEDNTKLEGLKNLDEWMNNIKIEKKIERNIYGEKTEKKQFKRKRMPTKMILNTGKLLEEAYKKLGFAQATDTDHPVVELEKEKEKLMSGEN